MAGAKNEVTDTKTYDFNPSKLELKFGATVDPLVEQLKSAGVKVGFVTQLFVEDFQRDADAILRLWIKDMLSDTEAKSARTKLNHKIIECLKKG